MNSRRRHLPLRLATVAVAAVLMGPVAAQTPPAGDGMAPRPSGGAEAERGATLYRPSCGFCHGAEAGGAQGPALTTSGFFTADDQGQALAAFLKVGRPANGMPPFPALPEDQVGAIHAFVRSRAAAGPARAKLNPSAILVGDAAAGRAYFEGEGRCATCHSTTADLKGVGTRYDAMQLQGRIINPRFGQGPTNRPARVKVTGPRGGVVEGALVQINDFFVTLIDAKGVRRTIARDNDRPKVEVQDPAEAHRAMMLTWTDRNMHNVTAYLASLK